MVVRAVQRLAIGVAFGLVLLGATASPALAQEWTIHLHGHTVPVKAKRFSGARVRNVRAESKALRVPERSR